MSNEKINLCKLCPLCRDSNEWPYPENGHYLGVYHFTLGRTWKPEKGHGQYELHKRLEKINCG